MNEDLEIVVTPPEQFGTQLAQLFSIRTTLGALTQQVAQAVSHILIASPFIQPIGESPANPLIDALHHALLRKVTLNVISTADGIRNFKTGWIPLLGKGKIQLFQPKPNIDNSRLLGSHAKVLITDREHAYIGSANFTHLGLTSNLEMGVLIHGSVATQASGFWEYLINIRYLEKMKI